MITLDGRLEIRFTPALQGNPFQALSALMVHETLHQDPGDLNGIAGDELPEEVINTAFIVRIRLVQF